MLGGSCHLQTLLFHKDLEMKNSLKVFAIVFSSVIMVLLTFSNTNHLDLNKSNTLTAILKQILTFHVKFKSKKNFWKIINLPSFSGVMKRAVKWTSTGVDGRIPSTR